MGGYRKVFMAFDNKCTTYTTINDKLKSYL